MEEEEDMEVEEEEVEEAEADSFVNAKDAIKSTANDVALLAKGSDSSVDNLPDQTAELLKKQRELMSNMEKLQPLLDTAEKFIGSTKKIDGFATLGSSYAEYK